MIDKLNQIKAFAFDCDGVMTSGTTQIDAGGNALRTFNIKDGFAVQHAIKQGYPVAIISGGNNSGISVRFNTLGVKNTDIYLGQSNKVSAFKAFCNSYNLIEDDVLYMGDDMPDIPLLKRCGLGCCPKDAANDVIENAIWVSSKEGGKGCAREIIEMVMKVQNSWHNEDLHTF